MASSPEPTNLAIYDMDKTLTKAPTYTAFLMHVAMRRAPWRFILLPLVGLSLLAFLFGMIDRARLKEWNHRLLIGHRLSREKLSPLVRSFAERVMRSNIRPGTHAALAKDREDGRMLVMATASYRFYAAAIGEKLGFDHIIGTNSVLGLDAEVHARIDGENCYGPAKLRMIEAWLLEHNVVPGHVRFYSDHHSDQPAFDWSDEPVAVHPDPKLLAIAKARGWRIEDWG
ncbi:MAG: HAD-IB family phosphatase [Sphingomonas sp.]|nr:HAD-IB family phosphatase [Sphingomonas sp.]